MPTPSPLAAPPRAGLVRRAWQALVPPPVTRFWRDALPLVPAERPRATIVAMQRISPRAMTLTLRPDRRWGGFRPGQHVDVTAEIDGRQVVRSYSPRAVPGADRAIELTIGLLDTGTFSRHLIDSAKPGDRLVLGRAYGDMTLAGTEDRPLLLLAAGTGITPMLAMLRSLASRPSAAPVTLAWWARQRDDLWFADELRALAATLPSLQVRFFLTRDSAGADDEQAGRIDRVDDVVDAATLAASTMYACGPSGFVRAARDRYAAGAQRFHAESFSPIEPVDAEAGTVTVTFARRGQTYTVPRGRPLLDALEGEGATLKSGCRRGICNTCACVSRSGSTRDVVSGAVTTESQSVVKLCSSVATSDLILEL